MKNALHSCHATPKDADIRCQAEMVICYDVHKLPPVALDEYKAHRKQAKLINQHEVQPRNAAMIKVKKGQFFRIACLAGSQVGDLNLWNAHNIHEYFYAGKTRALHGTHLSTGDRLWSKFPHLNPMATIIDDTLDWYGYDQDGASVHDVIGTRCDPYTHALLHHGTHYDYCCHSNLMRALANYLACSEKEAEPFIHDVLNLFMCTGFHPKTKQYFMKASPARQGDYIEFYAQMDLLIGLSACPGGDCASEHSSDKAQCHPLTIQIYSLDKAE